jgi:hypothetical protein
MADPATTLYSSDQNPSSLHQTRLLAITHHNLLSEGATAMIGVPQLGVTQIRSIFLGFLPHIQRILARRRIIQLVIL